jgi:hypothetical protein
MRTKCRILFHPALRANGFREIRKGLQNLYASVRFRPAPPTLPKENPSLISIKCSSHIRSSGFFCSVTNKEINILLEFQLGININF